MCSRYSVLFNRNSHSTLYPHTYTCVPLHAMRGPRFRHVTSRSFPFPPTIRHPSSILNGSRDYEVALSVHPFIRLSVCPSNHSSLHPTVRATRLDSAIPRRLLIRHPFRLRHFSPHRVPERTGASRTQPGWTGIYTHSHVLGGLRLWSLFRKV